MQGLVELLGEKGLLTKQELLERVTIRLRCRMVKSKGRKESHEGACL